ncbi:hypothetical protein NQ315_000993 [Exocentrus adspersus]|uniref:Uncharacterized protein n=1 Tax=Exocentrus adspersus TaxID=1586481 RepID=A0AAV8WE91_9CUCU|nr:hypothetical protein NQ315_000993 [Exocentrus adspersus]
MKLFVCFSVFALQFVAFASCDSIDRQIRELASSDKRLRVAAKANITKSYEETRSELDRQLNETLIPSLDKVYEDIEDQIRSLTDLHYLGYNVTDCLNSTEPLSSFENITEKAINETSVVYQKIASNTRDAGLSNLAVIKRAVNITHVEGTECMKVEAPENCNRSLSVKLDNLILELPGLYEKEIERTTFGLIRVLIDYESRIQDYVEEAVNRAKPYLALLESCVSNIAVMYNFKHSLILVFIMYSKQDCSFNNSVFSCTQQEMDSVPYEFNLKKIPDAKVSSIEIALSSYPTIENFFLFMDRNSKEEISGIKINDCKVKQVNGNAFQEYTSLRVLDLSGNVIEDMGFVKYLPSSITVLNLSNNSFTYVDDVFSNLKNLQYVHLSFCKLTEMDFTVFKEVVSLELVNVSNNNIQSSVSKQFLKNIKCVDISYNDLTRNLNIPSFCLDFSHTNISGYNWYNISSNNVTVFVEKFYYVGNKNLSIRATNLNKDLTDVEISYLNVSEYKSNISDFDLKKVKVTKQLILKESKIPLLEKSVYDFKELFYDKNPDTIFDLSNNSIAEITGLYFENYDLGVLNLCYNNIKNLEPNTFYKARFGELLLCRCSIENIHADAFNEATIGKLNLSYNRLDKIIFLSNITSLVELDLSYNLIEFINANSFTGLNDLEIINLSNNLINALEAGTFNSNKLIEIDLSNNNLAVIKSLSFSDLPCLNKLLLSQNPVQTVETNSFKSLPTISVLNLSDMNIQNIQEASFTDLPGLKVIYLHNNKIKSLTALNGLNLETFEVTLQGFESNFNLPQLKILYITNSNIPVLTSAYFLGLYNLQELHLKDSVIHSLEPGCLKGLFQLQYLDPQVFHSVKVLKTNLFNDLKSLQQLDLSRLKITVIEPEAFLGLLKLEKLCLSYNNISELNDYVFVGLGNVVTLDLSENNVTKLYQKTFTGLDGLRELKLNGNNLYSIPLGSLQDLAGLEVLNLARNKITVLNVGTFTGLKNLKTLNLSGNSVVDLCPGVVFPLKNLQELYLDGNNLNELLEMQSGRKQNSIYSASNFEETVFEDAGNIVAGLLTRTCSCNNHQTSRVESNPCLDYAKANKEGRNSLLLTHTAALNLVLIFMGDY